MTRHWCLNKIMAACCKIVVSKPNSSMKKKHRTNITHVRHVEIESKMATQHDRSTCTQALLVEAIRSVGSGVGSQEKFLNCNFTLNESLNIYIRKITRTWVDGKACLQVTQILLMGNRSAPFRPVGPIARGNCEAPKVGLVGGQILKYRSLETLLPYLITN